MQENDKNGPLQDDEAKKRLQGELRSNREEERSLEPSGEDQPDPELDEQTPRTGAAPEGMSHQDVQVRTELAQHLGRHVYPADRAAVVDALREENAPDRLVGLAQQLPVETRFENVQQIMEALDFHTESHRT